MNNGRNSKISKERIEQVVKYLEDGNYILPSCIASGISSVTYYAWLHTAEELEAKLLEDGIDPSEHIAKVYKAKPRNKKDYELALKLNFLYSTREAIAKAEVDAVSMLKAHGAENYQAIIKMLERRHRTRWGASEKIEVTGAGGGPIKTEASVKVAPSVILEAAEALRQAGVVPEEDKENDE